MRAFRTGFVLTVMAAFGCATAAAKDAAKTPSKTLPGVTDGYSIVKPLPEPDDEPAQAGTGNHFKVGDVDVRISGSIIFDVGVGSVHPSRH
jgi:hypothetical protein